jgi:hypothetical protein
VNQLSLIKTVAKLAGVVWPKKPTIKV